MKRLVDEKGSTLMLILITVAILTMLGTALLAMSLMNVTMKANDKRITSTVYLAESGIDQVYAIVGTYVEEAIEEAIILTDAEIQLLLGELDLIINFVDVSTGLVNPLAHPDWGTVGSVYLYGDYSLNVSELELHSDDLYKEHFKDYLDDLEDLTPPNNLSSIISAETYIDLLNDGVSSLSVTVGDVNKFSETPGNSEYIIRDVRSEFVLLGKTKKVVTTDIVVTDEITAYPLNTLENRISVKDNPLWQQALVANENIHVQGNGQLTVIGNVYGYGTLPASVVAGGATKDAEPTEYGGVIFDGSSQSIINGNVYSRNYVQLAEGSYSTVVVNDGAVYANTLIAQKDSNGLLRVNGNVYTLDDLEHNGDNADITINGSYYGYSDGSVGLTHDTSSAIVINADTSPTSTMTPTLHISGLAPYTPGPGIAKTNVHIESNPGVIIGGTGYIDKIIDPINNTRYQMAESIAFRENALAYTWAFSKTLIDNLIATNSPSPYVITPGNKFGFYPDDATQDSRLDKYLNKDNVSWLSVTPSVSLAIGSDDGSFGQLRDRKAIFATFQNEIDTGGTFVNDGGANVTISNYIYTTGLQLVGNRFEYEGANQSFFESLRVDINNDYLYQLHKLEPRNGAAISGLETVAGGNAPTIANANAVLKYSNIEISGINSFDVDIDGTTNIATAYNISDQSAQDLTIYGGSGTNGINALYMNGATKIQGIILRRGDIYIEGNVVFDGPIISNKSIYIKDGATLTIENKSFDSNESTKEILARLIFSIDDLFEVFNVTNYGIGGAVDPISLIGIEFSTIDLSGATYDPNNNSVFTYYDWIHFNHWKVAE